MSRFDQEGIQMDLQFDELNVEDQIQQELAINQKKKCDSV